MGFACRTDALRMKRSRALNPKRLLPSDPAAAAAAAAKAEGESERRGGSARSEATKRCEYLGDMERQTPILPYVTSPY